MSEHNSHSSTTPAFTGAVCPIPIKDYPQVLLAHGGGGNLMNDLIEKIFLPAFSNDSLQARHDGAVLPFGNARLAFTTDSYVIHPLFFPGGDIGSMAVHGTANDLAMCGAKPLYLSAGFILEEGLPMETLWRIAQSMSTAAKAAGMRLVTGDTKVVNRGKGDGVFINTAGIGIVEHAGVIAPQSVRSGDAILISGDIGRHGIAIMAVREGLSFETTIESDSACVAPMALDLLDAGLDVHCMRDLTRGGLASALVEIAEASRFSIAIEEKSIPVALEVRGACEILGFDPLYVANEGRFAAFVHPDHAIRALEILKKHPNGQNASIIGSVGTSATGRVTMKSVIGTSRRIDRLSGEQLPRIC